MGWLASGASVVVLVLLFLLGRKTGQAKEKEKNAVENAKKEAEVRNAETKTQTTEKKAELATKVSASILGMVRNVPELANLQEQVKQVEDDSDAIRIANEQAAQAKEFMLR